LSSTTDRSTERGQVLVLFAGALVLLFLIAAVAFDVGSMLLERRTEQNVADAAALAGARYVASAPNFGGTCASASGNPAANASCEVARANNASLADSQIQIDIPPVSGAYRGYPGFVQVRITTTKGSVFGGIIGTASWPVGVNAVAANQQGVTYSFGMLALDTTACKAILISGTGVVNSSANVQSNSDGSAAGCGGIGFSRTGSGTLNVSATDATCRSASAIQDQGAGTMTCAKSPYSFSLPDPLRNVPAPTQPALAPAMKEVVSGALVTNSSNIPKYCPGATGANAPSLTNPQTCTIGLGSGAGLQWVLYPGLYPAGIWAKGGVTLYLTPGIYWIGGGGFQVTNNASLISVNSETDRTAATCTVGSTPPCINGGGIMIYNSQLSNSAAGPISLGGGGATLNLQPYPYTFGSPSVTIPLVIFQDRTVAAAITLNGSDSQAAMVRGVIYAPLGDVTVNGSTSVFTMDQVIANTFKINGSGGTVNVLREDGVDAKISAVGLVE
jgi:hypothetical protein